MNIREIYLARAAQMQKEASPASNRMNSAGGKPWLKGLQKYRPGIAMDEERKMEGPKVRMTEKGVEVDPDASGLKLRNQQLNPGSEKSDYDEDNRKDSIRVEKEALLKTAAAIAIVKEIAIKPSDNQQDGDGPEDVNPPEDECNVCCEKHAALDMLRDLIEKSAKEDVGRALATGVGVLGGAGLGSLAGGVTGFRATDGFEEDNPAGPLFATLGGGVAGGSAGAALGGVTTSKLYDLLSKHLVDPNAPKDTGRGLATGLGVAGGAGLGAMLGGYGGLMSTVNGDSLEKPFWGTTGGAAAGGALGAATGGALTSALYDILNKHLNKKEPVVSVEEEAEQEQKEALAYPTTPLAQQAAGTRKEWDARPNRVPSSAKQWEQMATQRSARQPRPQQQRFLNPHHERTYNRAMQSQQQSGLVNTMRDLGLRDDAIQRTMAAFNQHAQSRGLKGDAYRDFAHKAIAQMKQRALAGKLDHLRGAKGYKPSAPKTQLAGANFADQAMQARQQLVNMLKQRGYGDRQRQTMMRNLESRVGGQGYGQGHLKAYQHGMNFLRNKGLQKGIAVNYGNKTAPQGLTRNV